MQEEIKKDKMAIETKYSYNIENIQLFSDPESTSWIHIGKFCSIGPNIKAYVSGHNMQMISTYPFLRHKEEFPKGRHNNASKGDIVIGNDVWIGARSILLNGVKIGDGAIIGAGSVVCKDIAPYTVAAGNPCKPIRKRYSDEQIDALLKIQWWTWDHPKINEALPLLQSNDVQGFIDKYLPKLG